MKKAKYIGRLDGSGWNATLEYEYRGHHYTICTGLYTSTAAQHRMEQERIDAQIEREEHAEQAPANPINWDEIWEMLGWN